MSSSGIYRGSLTTIILKLLSEKNRMYGYEITRAVESLTKGKLKITEGALYPALHKLTAQGLLETEVIEVDGRMRKYYRLTETGDKECTEKISELEAMMENLRLILNAKPGLIN